MSLFTRSLSLFSVYLFIISFTIYSLYLYVKHMLHIVWITNHYYYYSRNQITLPQFGSIWIKSTECSVFTCLGYLRFVYDGGRSTYGERRQKGIPRYMKTNNHNKQTISTNKQSCTKRITFSSFSLDMLNHSVAKSINQFGQNVTNQQRASVLCH